MEGGRTTLPKLSLAHCFSAGTIDRRNTCRVRAEAAEVLRINSKFLVYDFAKALPYKDQSVIENIINASHKAGLK